MSASAIKPDRLIRAVEKHPCLWDPKSIDYNAKSKRVSAWNSVCEEVFGDEFRRSKGAQKLVMRTDAKKRWRPIQDYYRNLVCENIKRQTKYVHYDLLEFLRPIYEEKKSAKSNLMFEEYLELDSWDQENRLDVDVDTEDSNIAFETSNVEEEDHQEELEDPDLLFFKSLLPDMKMLSDIQKFDFKLGIMHLYKSIRNGDEHDYLEKLIIRKNDH